jgi:hypothetical protein
MVRVTLLLTPAVVNVWVTIWPVPVAPSPNVQL